MKKGKKLKQGMAVPLWLKQSLRVIEGISPAVAFAGDRPKKENLDKDHDQKWDEY